jgi:signal transduction histidine kinase
MAWACCFWLIAGAVLPLIAWLNGGDLHACAALSAVAMIPALAGFALLPHLGGRAADAAFMGIWLVAAVTLTAATGGANSPLVLVFSIPLGLTVALRRAWASEIGAAAVLGFAAAAALAVWFGGFGPLGALREMIAVAALALTAGLMAMNRAAEPRGAGARIAEVSHELRTPLTHILGFSEMIERQIFGPISERYVEYAGLIRTSGVNLLEIVNDLLDLSRLDAGRYELTLEIFDVRTAIEEVVRLSSDAAQRKTIHLGMVTPDAPLMARADSRALKRILINTVGNAIKFTPEGGRVIARASATDGVLLLETIDNGPGIPEADRDRLGEAYERGSGGALAEGTGLGLSLVRALAVLHGGALSFHEAPGGGALVRVTLPVLVQA